MMLADATADPDFWLELYNATRAGWKGRSVKGLYVAEPKPGAKLPRGVTATVLGVEQSNSSAIIADGAFGKLYRKLASGPNAEAEMLEYLTAAGFPFVPRMKADLVYRRNDLEITLGIFQEPLDGEGDAWSYALREFDRYLERVADGAPVSAQPPARYDEDIPVWLQDSAPEVLELAKLLGVRTAELHKTMAKATSAPLAPVDTKPEELAAMAARIREEAKQTRQQLEANDLSLDNELLDRADELLDALAASPGGWHKIRVHGDYHLGQVLQADGDFYLLDFEGEPGRPPEKRREKDQALRDVAGMLRSFDYAGLMCARESGDENEHMRQATLLIRWAEAAFLDAYFSTAGDDASFIPNDPAVRDLILWAYTLDKVLYEIRYELGSRPDWVGLPLSGLKRLLARD
jgi:maltose alpha-D-glucosyltransferase/alpha-amylase